MADPKDEVTEGEDLDILRDPDQIFEMFRQIQLAYESCRVNSCGDQLAHLQAEGAKEAEGHYLEEIAELKKIVADCIPYQHENDSLTAEIKELRAKLEEMQKTRSVAQSEFQTELEQSVAFLEKNDAELRSKVNELSLKLHEADSDLIVARRQWQNFQQESENLKKRIANADQQINIEVLKTKIQETAKNLRLQRQLVDSEGKIALPPSYAAAQKRWQSQKIQLETRIAGLERLLQLQRQQIPRHHQEEEELFETATDDYAYDPEFEQQLQQPNSESVAENGFCSAGGSRGSPAKRRRVQHLTFTPNSVSNYLD